MLHEISNAKHSNQRLYRRWFTDNDMDLFVWFSKQMPIGFQLGYNKQNHEKAICWEIDKGFQHYRIDSADSESIKHNMTPLNSVEDDFDTYAIARTFLHNSENIETTLADFIYARLLEYPMPRKKHVNRDVASSNY